MAHVPNVKCVLVGECAVGKTTLLIALTENRFAVQWVPSMLDNVSIALEAQGRLFNLNLWEVRGTPGCDYTRLRSLSYPETDVFLVFFSIIHRYSLERVKDWVQEVRHNCPDAKVFVVLTKLDLRDDPATNEQLKDMGKTMISEAEGRELANEVGADKYMECSTMHGINLKELFEEVCSITVSSTLKDPTPQKISTKRKKCPMM